MMFCTFLKVADEEANKPVGLGWCRGVKRPLPPVQTDILPKPQWLGHALKEHGEGLEQQGGIESIPDEVR